MTSYFHLSAGLIFALAGTLARANDLGRACAWSLGADQRVIDLVDQSLSVTIEPDAQRANGLLYHNLVHAIAFDLSSRPEVVRRGVLNALRNAKPTSKGFIFERTWARVDVSNDVPSVFYVPMLDSEFALMIYLGHEAVHLVEDYEYTESEPGLVTGWLRFPGPLATYLSERKAIAREFDLGRATFGPGEDDRLRALYFEPFRRFLEQAPEETFGREDAVRYMKLLTNFGVAQGMIRGTATSKRQFVSRRLQSYRFIHARVQAARALGLMPLVEMPTPEEVTEHIDLVTRVNLDIYHARYPHKLPIAAPEDLD